MGNGWSPRRRTVGVEAAAGGPSVPMVANLRDAEHICLESTPQDLDRQCTWPAAGIEEDSRIVDKAVQPAELLLDEGCGPLNG